MSLPLHVRPEAALAFGIFTPLQAAHAGCPRSVVLARVRTGRWTRLERGVLARRDRDVSPLDPLVVAVLRAGPAAVASHLTAAAALGWDLLERPKHLDVSVPRNRTRARGGPGVRVHVTDDVLPSRRDVDLVAAVLPVTSPWRTAQDICRTRPFEEAVVALDSAVRARSVRWAAVEEAQARSRCGRFLRVVSAASPLAGSVPETLARLVLQAAGVPLPVQQYEIRVGGRLLARVDLAWPHARVAVEVDGWSVHGGQEAFDRDRRRQNPLELEGWTVLRYSPRMIREHPEQLVADVCAALGC